VRITTITSMLIFKRKIKMYSSLNMKCMADFYLVFYLIYLKLNSFRLFSIILSFVDIRHKLPHMLTYSRLFSLSKLCVSSYICKIQFEDTHA